MVKIFSLEKLIWDSSFFKKDVFKLITDEKTELNIKDFPANALVYIFSSSEINGLKDHEFDTKVTFGKKLDRNLSLKSGYSLASEGFQKKSVIYDLAVQAGHLSRFRRDPKISNERADKLYHLWVDKAFDDLDNHRIIYIDKKDDIAGMLILSMKENESVIDLIAVHKNYQKQGIGQALVEASFCESLKKGKENIKVVTQLHNKGACLLYKKCGFKLETSKYIYHIHTQREEIS